ncbi:hypothetical protein [Curtobacterium sp. VKM Ac-2884]|uniref:hypothetical protein n=1 Tax=Curtobacterium sp. VKM Ac-2884 TaxID=2783818 RepID=UPI001889D3DE|nr:hypothetical protein [Curtobacterium sp. VKM Ac-2884]MBF4602815.1 hypothetical protein [Curtobacterium sp. VKM Ac-2884]
MTIAPPDTDDDELTLTLLVERARRRLVEAPELVEYVRIRRQPGGAVRDGQPGAPSRTPPAPLHIGALDDADQIYVDLVGHVRRWARDLSVSTLKVALRSGEWTTDGVLLGFRSTTTPPGAARLVRDLTDWLLLHLDRIAAHAGGPAFLDEVAVAIEAVYSRFPLEARPDRPHWRRPCEVCGEFAVTADWAPDAEIRDVTVWCESCSHVLVSTTKDGTVNTAEGATADQRAAARKLTRIVRQIAVGTSVPRVEGVPA